MLKINTNVPSLMAQRNLTNNYGRLNDNLRKLSSGTRITRAGDDAAGLAISENLRAQIRGVKQATRNGNDAISLIQTAEGGLNEISNIIIRLRELSMQSASDTIGDKEREFVDIEFQGLKEELDRISKSSEFNGRKLLDGTGGLLEFQVGIRNDPVLDRLRYDGTNMDSSLAALGIAEESVLTRSGAQLSLNGLDNALVKVNGIRAELGATQNRLQSTVRNLGVSEENMSAAHSRVRDVDMASETASMAKNNILTQAGASVLTQANALPNVALKLLG